MGIYWQTWICYGFRTNQTERELTEKLELDKSYFIEDTKGCTVTLPKSRYSSDSLDTIIKDYKETQCYVSKDEIIRGLKIDPIFFEISNEDKKMMESLSDQRSQWWIIQYQWYTIGGISPLYFEFMLPIN